MSVLSPAVGSAAPTPPDYIASAPLTVSIGCVRSITARSLLLIGEVVVIPAVLLFLFVRAGTPMTGLVVVFGWRASCIAARLLTGRTVPTTAWFAFAMFTARAIAGLALASVAVYLWEPVAMSVVAGSAFMASALAAKPLTLRMVRDFIRLDEHVSADRRVRSLFAQLALWWGLVHVGSGLAGAWAFRLPLEGTVAVHGALGICCTVVSVGGCVAWGLYRAMRIPGLRIQFGEQSA